MVLTFGVVVDGGLVNMTYWWPPGTWEIFCGDLWNDDKGMTDRFGGVLEGDTGNLLVETAYLLDVVKCFWGEST